MKERVFYVLNLDNKRIISLIFIFTLVVGSFFFLGLSIGKRLESNNQVNLALSEQKQNINQENHPETIQDENKNSLDRTDKLALKNVTPGEEVVDLNENQEKSSESLESNEIANKNVVFPKEESVSKRKTETVKTSKNSSNSKKISNSNNNNFTVQIAAFKNSSKANQVLNELKNSKLKPYITKKNEYYLVRVGKSSDKVQLKKLLSKLDKKYQQKAVIMKY